MARAEIVPDDIPCIDHGVRADHGVIPDNRLQFTTLFPFEIDYDKAFNGKELNLEIRKNEPLKQEIESFCNSVEARLRSTEDYEPLGMNPGAMDDEDYAYIPKICKECLRSAETGREIELSWRS